MSIAQKDEYTKAPCPYMCFKIQEGGWERQQERKHKYILDFKGYDFFFHF